MLHQAELQNSRNASLKRRPQPPRVKLSHTIAFVLVFACFPELAWGQILDADARRRIDILRGNDAVLESEISAVRVDRQAEIARLEGRILQLEDRLRSQLPRSDAARFATVLHMLHALEPVEPPSAAADSVDQGSSEADGSQSPDTTPPPAPSENQPLSHELPEPHPTSREQLLARTIAQDYLLALQIDRLDAEAELMEKSQELKSLERLSAKGLASNMQVELVKLEKRRAELQSSRLAGQAKELQRLNTERPPSKRVACCLMRRKPIPR